MLTIGIPHWMQSKIERIEKIDQLEEMRPFMPPILFVDLFDLLTGKKAEQIIKQRDENKIRYENREYEIMAIILESPNAKKIADKLSRGHIIREKYSIESLVGFDQYEKRSIIYKVKDLDNRFAGFRAIKIFLQDDERTEQIIENELTVRQNIVHENISRCFGLDRFESSGERFLILEYHEGRLLAEFEKYRYINTRELFGYVAQILSGLKRMHEAKFVHGKISPDHIVVDEKNTVKIVSFDNSSISGSDLSFSAGIPNYRPPDFMKIGWHFSWDTYAVGVILYKLLVGRFPDAINPSIPKNKIIELGRDVSEFIEKACQPKRICRFENAGEMLEALGRIKKFKQ
jgi:serine/threonine protein kinase